MERKIDMTSDMKQKLSRLYSILGNFQYWKKCHESSLSSYTKSLELFSDNLTAFEGAADSCRGLGRLEEAKESHLQFLVKAPKCHKEYSGALYRLAEINFLMLNVPEFCHYYEKAMQCEKSRLPFLSEVDIIVKKFLFGFYLISKTDELPFCTSCLQQ